MINKAYKFRIYPTKTQQEKLNKTFGCVRFIWNKKVEKFLNQEKDSNKIKDYREEFEWMKEVSYNALSRKVRDFDEFKKQKFNKSRKKKLGQPKFKKKNQYQSFRLDNLCFYIKENKIWLVKIGKVKIILDREIPDNAKLVNVTVSKNKSDQYFVSICVEQERQLKQKTNKQVGIDVGIKSFIVTSDNEIFDNPKFFSNSQAKLARLQMFQAKKKGRRKGEQKSRRWLKLQKRINRLHNKIVNQRDYFLHNISSYLVNNYDVICAEDLNIEGLLKNRKLSKAISDVSWSKLFSQIDYKCNWYGKEFVKIDRFYPSSKTCSVCGKIKEDLKLSDRIYECECGNVIDRDYNAANNIKAVGVNAAQRTPMVAVTKPDEAFTNSF